MKKSLKLFIILISAFCLLTACGIKETDGIKFKNEYESLNAVEKEKNGLKTVIRSVKISENNPIVYVNEDEVLEKIKTEKGVVYFGFADCPWCRSMIETLLSVANDLNIEKIYYVDVKNIRDTIELNDNNELVTTKKGTDGYYNLLTILNDVLNDYTIKDKDNNSVSANEKRIFAPNVVTFDKGNILGLETGISENQENAYQELTDEIKKDMKCKLECLLEKIEEKNVCDKSC